MTKRRVINLISISWLFLLEGAAELHAHSAASLRCEAPSIPYHYSRHTVLLVYG